MKHFIIFLLAATMLSAGAFEADAKPSYARDKSHLKFDASLFGGYNFTGNGAVYGGTFAVEAFFIRADVDVEGTSVNSPLCKKPFISCGPSIGVFVGKKHKVYAMYGIQNYAAIITTDVTNCARDVFYTDLLHHKLKFGYQAAVWENLFVSAEVCHLVKAKLDGHIMFPYTDAHIGLGVRF